MAIPAGLQASLVLVRHGESTWITEHRFQGRGDPPLSELGQRQAALVGARLARPQEAPRLPLPGAAPLGIWHSPLRRAAQTAWAIAEATTQQAGAPIPLHPAEPFTEIAQGAWEGLLAAEVEAGWGRTLASWRRDPTHAHAPGGESLLQADQRVAQGLAELVAVLAAAAAPTTGGTAGKAAAMGASAPSAAPATVGRTFVPGYGQPPEDHPWAIIVAHDGIFRLTLLRLLGLSRSHFWSLPFALAGITVVELRDGLTVLRAHGLEAHLAPLADAAQDAAGADPAAAEARAHSGAL